MKKTIAIAAIVVGLVGTKSYAFDTRLNPDQFPSVGFDIIKMQQQGLPRAGVDGATTDGQGAGARLDLRYPVSNEITFHAAAESLTIDNNLQYTEGYRIEIGMRVYFTQH